MFNAARHTISTVKGGFTLEAMKVRRECNELFKHNCQPGILYQVKIFQNQTPNYGFFGHKHESPQEDQHY